MRKQKIHSAQRDEVPEIWVFLLIIIGRGIVVCQQKYSFTGTGGGVV